MTPEQAAATADMAALLIECQRQLDAARAENARLVDVVMECRLVQSDALRAIKAAGFVFTADLGKSFDAMTPAERWEKLAFTLYTDLVKVSQAAAHALEKES